MELRINRTEQNEYQLTLGDTLIIQGSLKDVIDRSKDYAKKLHKNIMISAASVSDWYCGFPVDKNQAPTVFYDPHFLVKATLDTPTSYRFIEGPFLTSAAAVEAAFKISGKAATVQEPIEGDL